MPFITYKFADGHTEEIEVTDEVATAFKQFQKYEKSVERKDKRRHNKSLEKLSKKVLTNLRRIPMFLKFGKSRKMKNLNYGRNDGDRKNSTKRKSSSKKSLPLGKQKPTFCSDI